MRPPGRSAVPPPTRCGASRPGARANVKRGVYRLADEATNAFQHARERWRAMSAPPTRPRSCSRPAARWRSTPPPMPWPRRLRPGDEILISRARASQQHRALADGGGADRRTGPGDPGDGRGPAGLRATGRARLGAHPDHRGRPCLQRHRGRGRGGAPARCRPCGGCAPAARRRADGAARAARRPRPGLRPVRVLGATRCSARPAPACSGAARSCWPSCRRSWAAAR